MTRHGRRRTGWFLAAAFALAVPLAAQETSTQAAPAQAKASSRKLAVGRDIRVEGVISQRDGDSIILTESGGSLVSIALNPSTQILERKSNPFRGATRYSLSDLVAGLKIEARGYGGPSGELVAKEVRMRDDDLRVAESIQTRVAPVEGRLGETENRLKLAENETEHLAGQVKELTIVSSSTRRDVQSAHEKADAARLAANNANATAVAANAAAVAANERIGTLDDFDTNEPVVVLFKFGSSAVEPEAMASLDELAERAKTLKGYQLEVRGFASSDGKDELNRRLSRNRADAVVRYFVEKHDIPLRRILLPYGYGESQPVADNSTRDGRRQNRRVEVRILVNRGLAEQSAQVAAGTSNNH